VKPARALVAGIGNVFLGDDGFGVEVARRLAERPAREHVRVADFGIRGMDLTYALLENYDRVILVDAAPRGRAPGTLYVLEPDLAELGATGATGLDAHGLVPTQALSMAKAMGGRLEFVRIVGCEPLHLPAGDDIRVGLSPCVSAAVDGALALVEELLEAPRA
jgi:hydrogenase maturation protease